ncbi:MAG: nucleotidyl transferase AbiEii/AbiGii toxin family protein [Planctomycetota bacterium]
MHFGAAKTRMKDYFDLLAPLRRSAASDPALLASAIATTFARRRTGLPRDLPTGLGDRFATDPTKQKLWRAFLERSRLESPDLDEVVRELRDFLDAPLKAAVDLPHES